MRALFLHPWGSFYPATSGAEFVACAQLDYLQSRDYEIHCVMCRVLGQVPRELSRFVERFPGVRSITVLDVPARALTFRDLLFGYARAAASEQFVRVAQEKFDLFLANYVVSAPFACALPRSLFKIVETLDILAAMYRTLDLVSHPCPPSEQIQDLEEQFLFKRIELDLYRAFDRALMISQKEAQAVLSAGYPGAVYVAHPFPLAARRENGAMSLRTTSCSWGAKTSSIPAAYSGFIGIFTFLISGVEGFAWRSPVVCAATSILKTRWWIHSVLWKTSSPFTTRASWWSCRSSTGPALRSSCVRHWRPDGRW